MTPTLIDRIKALKLVIFDIDGVFTNGVLTFCEDGKEYKTFHVHDGLGVKNLMRHNIKVAIISGRKTNIVQRRFSELGVEHIYQGYTDKEPPYEELLTQLKLKDQQVAYVGDDLPDLPLIKRAGLGIAVANATPHVLAHATWQTSQAGGQGAVREICDFILKHHATS